MARKHLVWLDVARFAAMFFVVISHAGDTFNFNPPAGAEAVYGFWGAVWGSLARFCVPVFVMITGFLLLPVSGGTAPFLQKRISRVLWPFLVWSIIYNLLPFFVGLRGGTPDTLRVLIPFSEITDLSFGACLSGIAKIPLTFNQLTTHLWYVYMLIGIYLFLPIFSAWFERATEREKRAFLGIWSVTLLLPYVREYAFPVWGECEWNAFGMLASFSGFTGYLLLGSVLGRLELSARQTCVWAVTLFTAGAVFTFIGFRHVQALSIPYGPLTELYWTYNSLNVAMMSAAVFLAARKCEHLPTPLTLALADIGRCGYGIYVAHYAFIGAVYAIAIRPLDLPVALQLPVMAMLSYLLVWGLISVLRRIPGGSWITG